MCLDLSCNPHLLHGAVPDGAEHLLECKKGTLRFLSLEKSMKLFVGSGTLGLSAAISSPVGLLEAGTSGVTTSSGVAFRYFAIASDSVVIAIGVEKLAVSADHHESAFVITCVDAGLQGIVAFAEVGSQGVA